MATPKTWTTAEFVTAAMLNTEIRDQLISILAGGLALGSQAANDMLYASSATQLARAANGTTGQVWTATTSAPPGWATPTASGSDSENSVIGLEMLS